MSLWGWILLASLAAYLIKAAGYLVPAHWLESPRMTRVTTVLTVGLLAALTASNAFGAGQGIAFDARAGALLAAAIALWRGVPFLGVVVIGALAAALLRLLGVS